MSYVQKVLQPGENLVFTGTIHWLVYLTAILFALLGAVVMAAQAAFGTPDMQTPATLLAGAEGLIAVLSFIRAWFQRFTTEIAVTDKRVIFKEGFIRRNTTEMNMTRVESVEVDQSILERIFNYGDIIVRGTGAGLQPMRMIGKPIAFRNAVIVR